MRFLYNIIARIKQRRSRARKTSSADIPNKLDKETLEKAMQEARFLFQHAVDVTAMAPEEAPQKPTQVES